MTKPDKYTQGTKDVALPPAGAAELALPGRRRSAPSGGSDPRSGGAWGPYV